MDTETIIADLEKWLAHCEDLRATAEPTDGQVEAALVAGIAVLLAMLPAQDRLRLLALFGRQVAAYPRVK